ncbi:MAG: hypothetical protein P8H65_09925 [Rhodothermales bacterium]|nr:hypothetical protein [Rhodothermales bacterium]MDG2016058.1 hypothetical protein [Rhodothermales bacterium]
MKQILIILTLALSLTPVDGFTQNFRPQELDVQFHRAKTAFESGNSLLEAKARVDRVLNGLPNDLEALKLRTAILMGLQRPEEAVDDALMAVRIAESNGEAQLLLCESSMAAGNETLAKTALSTASDLIIESIDHLVRLSWCAVELGDLIRAESLSRIAIAQNPEDTRGHLQLARVFFRGGNEDAAAEVIANTFRSISDASELYKGTLNTYPRSQN